MIPDIKPELQELITNIGNRTSYSGGKIPASIMRMFEIIETDVSAGVLVPFWLPVVQQGRGPRKSNKDSGLWKTIYAWMQRKNLFRSGTPKGRVNEAKSLTWYINKFGNKHFRSKQFIDVYKTEREKTIEKINKKYGFAISKITMDIL
jgi:hypothetical protein